MTIAERITLLAQAIGLDIKALQQPKYFEQVLWAEENGAIANNQNEWSYGNGATGANIGIPSYWDCQAVGMIMNAETFGTSAIVNLNVNNVAAGAITATTRDTVFDFVAPVDISRGDRITFQTGVVVGTWSDVRVGVILRIPII